MLTNTRTKVVIATMVILEHPVFCIRLASGQDDHLASAFLPYEGTTFSAPSLENMVILDTPSWDILHVCAQAVLI